MNTCNFSASRENDIVSTGSQSWLSITSGKTKYTRKVSASGNSDTESIATNMSGKKFRKHSDHDLPKSTTSSVKESKSAGACTRSRVSWKYLSTGIAGLLDLRRLTIADPKPVESETVYENTYKMGPDSGQHFAISKIQQITFDILKTEIGESEYNGKHAGYLARFISEKIKSKVKELNSLARHRIICEVLITEVSGQGIQTASRCLWEPKVDNFTAATYKNQTICATATIFGIYFD